MTILLLILILLVPGLCLLSLIEKKTEQAVYKEGGDALLEKYKSKRGLGANLIRRVFCF